MSQNILEKSLRYIEANLKAPITARELAELSGYSLYRYYRLFQAETGMSVMRYILRRRLLAAARELRGGKKQIDAALLYGFDTHAGFYKAFRREFGCTPSQYLKNGGAFAPQVTKEVTMNESTPTGGRFLTCRDFYDEPTYAPLAGAALARLHRALLRADTAVDQVELYETVGGWALPLCRRLLDIPEAFSREYLQTLSALCPLLPVQTIHRDPNPSMFYVTPEGLALAPSPLAERNVRLYDPCYTATALLSESFDAGPETFGQWLGLYRGIVNGYAQEADMTDDERRAVPYVLMANQLICTAWFYEQKTEPAFFEVNRKMTLRLLSEFKNLSV